MNTELPHAPACERNKQPILEVLEKVLPDRGIVLEIGSCTGQHVVFFAPTNPRLSWQPSDRAENLEGLAARIRAEGSLNILPPLELDVTRAWPDKAYDAVYSANTAHIMSWREVEAMYAGVGRVIRTGGAFCLYGPFNVSGQYTAPSNETFDSDLKAQDPDMGLRDVDDLDALADRHHLQRDDTIRLPSNNLLLVYRKQEVE